MMRSLYSGVSGLKVHQTKMDVIGNNISNVNTVGFRGSTVNFTDVFYQTTQNASGPNATTGTAGTNAVQIGLGSNVAAISVDLSGTGATQRTDRGMDLMINGDAFLIVRSNGNTYSIKCSFSFIDALIAFTFDIDHFMPSRVILLYASDCDSLNCKDCILNTTTCGF